MAAANCATIFMGVDSGSPDIRRHLMERPMTDELIYKSAQSVKDDSRPAPSPRRRQLGLISMPPGP